MKTLVKLLAASALAIAPNVALSETISGGTGGGGGGSGSVTNIATSCGLAGGPITSTGTIQGTLQPSTKTTGYTSLLTDCGTVLFFNIASAQTFTLNNLTTTSNYLNVRNLSSSAGILTITPASGTIDGLASLTLQPGAPGLTIAFDGTNYFTSGVSTGGKVLINAQTGASYTVLATDYAKLVTLTNAGAIAVSLPSNLFLAGDFLTIRNLAGAAGVATITPTSGTVDGLTSIQLFPGTLAVSFVFDGTNWKTTGAVPGLVSAYKSGNWYRSIGSSLIAAGATSPAISNVYCHPFIVSAQGMTAQAIGSFLSTVGGGNASFALYKGDGAGGLPGTLIDKITASQSTAANPLFGAFSLGTVFVPPGMNWTCSSSDNTTVRYLGPSAVGTAWATQFIGGASIAAADTVSANTIGYTCAAATTCGSGFAAWSGTTFNWVTFNGPTWSPVTTAILPEVLLQAN